MELHFPLYNAPIEKSPSYAGKGISILSNKESDYCFLMGIGVPIVVNYLYCHEKNYIDGGDDEIGRCHSCGHIILKNPDAERLITYAEFRAGFGLITRDTELGMISEHQKRITFARALCCAAARAVILDIMHFGENTHART